jgi:hypothetical protein
MIGDWRRVSGASCAEGYRIGLSGGALTRAYASTSGWAAPQTASNVVNDNTVAWGVTQVRYADGRLYVTNASWSSGCEFVRGSPRFAPSSSGAPVQTERWRGMVGDWRRVSGTMCSIGYRIGLSGDRLTRAFHTGSAGWAAASYSSREINDDTVAWNDTILRYGGGRITVSNATWSSGCEFVRGAPQLAPAPSAAAAWRNMAGEWRRISGSDCSAGYRIGLYGATLTRAFFTGSGWGSAAAASGVNANTAAWGDTRLSYSGERIYATNPGWRGSCVYVRGAPPMSATASAPSATWRNMAGEWRRVSGADCSTGYRIAVIGDTLTRAFYTGTGWGAPAAASGIGSDTAAWGDTRVRYSGGRLVVTNPGWSSACQFVRGAP